MLRQNRIVKPVVKQVSYFLAHVPSMIRHGSKPSREIAKESTLLEPILGHLRTFEEAMAYLPNQIYIGNLDPDFLFEAPVPWYKNPYPNASRRGPGGEIMPEEEFYGMLKICDEFALLQLEAGFLREVAARLKNHPLFASEDIEKLGTGVSIDEIEEKINQEEALPLYVRRDRLIGCFQRAHEEDASLVPEVLIENLSAKASGALALRHLLSKTGKAADVDYLLDCGEEAVGDRYNRGGGSLSKAIGELCGCTHATGSDVKAFCCAPVHTIILAGSLITSGIYRNVILVAGGSFSKLGMKFRGHLKHDMPILEDCLAAFAVLISQDDGKSPVISLDCIGKHEIGAGSTQEAIIENLVGKPLEARGLKMTDIDKYATEMHNPEITEPQGSGNVPRTNYRILGGLAILRGQIGKEELDHFVKVHGMLGFSPTQGHIASAMPVLGHSVRKMLEGKMKNTLFLAKGSLFLGRMSQLSDGISFLLEANQGRDSETGAMKEINENRR